MQVFKAFFKIILKNIPQMMIYIFAFLGISMIFAFSATPATDSGFEETALPIGVINLDENNELTQGFTDFLESHFQVVLLENTEKAKQDALFYRKAYYIATIPQGFSQAFEAGEKPVIETVTIPNTAETFFVQQKVDQFLNTLWRYQTYLPAAAMKDLITSTQKDLDQSTLVDLAEFSVSSGTYRSHLYYYNFAAYALLAILILGISSIMMVFNQEDIKRRNIASPLKLSSYNAQLIAGSLLFSLVVWGLLAAVGFLFFWNVEAIRPALILCSINTFVMMLAALSISFLAGIFIKGKNTQSAVANVVSLGLCFLSGVFVPQFLLGEAVLTVAKFSPVFWFVRANDRIGELSVITRETLNPIISDMTMVLGFALVIIAVALIISKVRRERG